MSSKSLLVSVRATYVCPTLQTKSVVKFMLMQSICDLRRFAPYFAQPWTINPAMHKPSRLRSRLIVWSIPILIGICLLVFR